MALSRGSPLLPVFLTGLLWAVKLGSSPWAASGLSKFDDVIQPSWASDHVIYDGDLLLLKLDNFSGSGFASKNKYLYGKATADIKLVPGDSAGTVTAFYMSSEGASHNEFDFEFLGNRSGEPYLVQTNLYINGVGNREQRMDLWFDPAADFHSYSILWNPRQVVFLVDGTPVRVYQNNNNSSSSNNNSSSNGNSTSSGSSIPPFPTNQPMGVYSSIWNADDWATEGGRVKTDWGHAPFVAAYREVRIDGCEWGPAAGDSDDAGELRRCSESAWGKEGRYWWKEKAMEELTVHQSHQLAWARAHHLVYDYCADPARFPVAPPECTTATP
ncbi:xyloglucan endotransglucosylase/hydrolase protein 9-like [Ananas comosus]|uniref:Xyloglucan endotransglucosylase/hydrolase n=1 Tax=Ananas comosus TaxID=4615 RepID=A0A199UFG4_ANACO|nr:xyloglucan endotransglucosylase/hydrolase protein 9-like [Ananas comosus]OAY63484.1 Xyloglucan endotransglucosylase/hydrolase protein 9 [Ananas comosus]